MVHTGQGQVISSGPLTPILDESPRNSLLLSSTNNSAASTPVSIKPVNWNKSDSEVGTLKSIIDKVIYFLSGDIYSPRGASLLGHTGQKVRLTNLRSVFTEFVQNSMRDI